MRVAAADRHHPSARPLATLPGMIMDSQPTRARSTRSVNAPRRVSMAFSSVGHDSSLTNNQGDPNSSRRPPTVIVEIRTNAPELDSEFAYPDGNIELQTSTHIFRVHEFQLAKFVKIAELIRQARERGDVTANPERRVKVNIQCTGKLCPRDIRHTLRVIYSSFVSGHTPPSFEGAILVSTLRVATLYQNPDLRSFAISQLQSRFALTPIHRIALSDELSIPDWEAPAFLELCRRSESLSQKEASVLGVARTVEIARLREAEQRHQYLSLVYQATTDPFLNAEGNVRKDKLQTAAEQTLKHSPLPTCNCRTQNDGNQNDASFNRRSWFGATEVDYNRRNSMVFPASFGLPSDNTCQIHQLAPAIALESRGLYKHLSGTLGRLAALKQAVSTKMRSLPGSDKDYSVENEIKKTNWARKAT
ncbi:hypothetical protein RSOLAG22IIIB_11053 [Rhizoctonia solani]|uniref:BTB domain-containing protein n=1 Tax=Rhizoctonia solani TaxID=456999 RepID=A0A0K6G6G1_9AGAM|nr:hypothetical protein RSOLAG22IIIB_11053 [Rhizoctonia solani]